MDGTDAEQLAALVDQLEKIQRVNDALNAAEKILAEVCPGGREFALVRTKLDEAALWAAASITGKVR